MTQSKRIATTTGEALAVVALCFGWAIYASLMAVLQGFPSGQGFTDAAALVLVTIEAIFAGLAIWLLRRRGYDVASLVPQVTWRDSATGLGLAMLVWVASLVAMAPFAGGQSEQPIERMMQASTITPPLLLLMALVNGTFEEVFLLGFLQRGLRSHGTSISLGVALLVRVSYHLYQGPLGAMSILGFGVVLGLYYARWQRLWPVVFAHIFWDIVPFLA